MWLRRPRRRSPSLLRRRSFGSEGWTRQSRYGDGAKRNPPRRTAAGATPSRGAPPCAPTIGGNFGFSPTVHFFNGRLGNVGAMKRSPLMQRLDEILRSSKLSAGGFLGNDRRPLEEIIEADLRTVSASAHSLAEIAGRMRAITAAARRGQEMTVTVDDKLAARVMAVRGLIPCPWPHPGRFEKLVTNIERRDSGKSIRWSDLNIHMIEAHGFFEGRGSCFRIEPRELIEIVFWR